MDTTNKSFAAHPAFKPIDELISRLSSTNTTITQIAVLTTNHFRMLGDFCVSSYRIPKINMNIRGKIKQELRDHDLQQAPAPLPLSHIQRESLLHSINAIGAFFEITPDLLHPDLNLSSGQYSPAALYVVEAFSRAARGLPLREPAAIETASSAQDQAQIIQYLDTPISEILERATPESLARNNIVFAGQLMALSKTDLTTFTGTAHYGLSPAARKRIEAHKIEVSIIDYNMRGALAHIDYTKNAATPFTVADTMDELRSVAGAAQDGSLLPTARAMDRLRTLFYTHARCYKQYQPAFNQAVYAAMTDIRQLTLPQSYKSLAEAEKQLADKVQGFMDQFAPEARVAMTPR